MINTIKFDASKTFGLHLSHMNSDEKVGKIVSLLGIFVIKRPDISYHFGMTYIIGFLISIFLEEIDIFSVFCYIIEEIFPKDFFSPDDRQLGLHKELRVISTMAEVLRPKLLNTLKAVFLPQGGLNKETDLTAFTLFIKRTSEM